MAQNYTEADLEKYQAKVAQSHQKGELRELTPDVFNSLKADKVFMEPSHDAIKQSAKRTTGEVRYFTNTTRSLGTGGEIHNHTGTKGTDAIVVPSWTVYDDKFGYSVKQANGSMNSLDEMLTHEMRLLNANFSRGLETVATNFVHANRSGVNVRATSSDGTFDVTNDVFEMTESFGTVVATGYRVPQIIKTTMQINKWGGQLKVYCDSIGFDKMETLANQGSGNSINSSFSFSGITWIKAIELDALAVALDATYVKGYFIAAEVGTTSVLDWIPEQNRTGLVTSVNKYGALIHPQTGLPLGFHSYEGRSDQSSLGGEPQDVRIENQFYSYISINMSPLSTADEEVFQAFALV